MLFLSSLRVLLLVCCCYVTSLLLLAASSVHSDKEVDATLLAKYRKQTLPRNLLPSSIDSDEKEYELDPALVPMTYDVGDGKQTTLVYMDPTLEQMYSHKKRTMMGSDDTKSFSYTKVVPKFNGFAAKFINMSNRSLILVWEDYPGGTRHEMRYHEPFSASGTGSFPTHRFLFTEEGNLYDPNPATTMIVGEYPNNIYVYDPYYVKDDPKQTEQNLLSLNPDERRKYEKYRKTLAFNEQYFQFTGRSYLANYLRSPPRHHMWRGDYFGQEHWVMTRETHFIQTPSEKELGEITSFGRSRAYGPKQKPLLHQYRDPNVRQMNMTLKTISVIPRAFTISNFLSPVEVAHILKLASSINLQKSKTGDSGRPVKDTTNTRTSFNSWVRREASPIIDAVYRRAADLMRIDESLFRYRDDDEGAEYNMDSPKGLTEDLQLVHYQDRQEYAAHHDFGYSKIDKPDNKQGARFATLLLYLNEGMKGGETTFPRWVNGETFKQLKIVPKSGDAALFYSQLPDGNLDDFSQHAALPVTDGEKWLINLWVWDPLYD